MEQTAAVGDQLRDWRQRRRLSQLDLACEAGISTRHLSFVETGRSSPSRDMVLRLADHLSVPHRERNQLLLAAGYAPLFQARPLDHPALRPASDAVRLILERQRPYPAFALDRHWNAVASNGALPELYSEVAPELLAPPMNVVRLSLHPKGLAPRILNLREWGAHLIHRLREQIDLTGDPALVEIAAEAERHLGSSAGKSVREERPAEVLLPLKIRGSGGVLSFFTTTLVFGTPVDVTLSELAIESFFPADGETAALVTASC